MKYETIPINLFKEEGYIPECMKEIAITGKSKPGAGSKFNLENERGIFKLSILRSLFFRITFNMKYDMIERNMTDSNMGAQK